MRLLETVLAHLVWSDALAHVPDVAHAALTVNERLLDLLPIRHDEGPVLEHLLVQGLARDLQHMSTIVLHKQSHHLPGQIRCRLPWR